MFLVHRLRELTGQKDKNFYVFCNEHHQETYQERMQGESPNDQNDRAIRKSVDWYNEHLNKSKVAIGTKVVLLSEDVDNVRKAKKDGMAAFGVYEYVASISGNPFLVERLARFSQSNQTDSDGSMTPGNSRKSLYQEHLSMIAIKQGIQSGRLSQGVFHGSRETHREGHVAVPGEEQWVLIKGVRDLNRAVDSDVVAIEMYPESEWTTPSGLVEDNEALARQEVTGEEEDISEELMETNVTQSSHVDISLIQPTGKVVGIIKRKWRPYCGTLLPLTNADATSHKFVPADSRIPPVGIITKQASLLFGKRIVVNIDEWPRSSRLPRGHLVRILGDIGAKAAENEVLLLEHSVPYQPFSSEVLADLPNVPWTIPEEERQKRTNLVSLEVCSIDPQGCTDIDDALHCRELEGGNFEVGVHIADVTYFIRPSTSLDKEASNRGTTVYLCDKRIDMVPELLSSNLCSLREGEERLAFSCIWELTPQADIVSTAFAKSIIKSRKAFTYAEAQMKVDDARQNDSLTLSLRKLNGLAKNLKQKRIEEGALTLASPEVRFEMDSETHDPIDIEMKDLKDTNSLVEEFMLLANISVAKRIFKEFPHCALLRRHPAPPPSNYHVLVKVGLSKGVHIAVETAKSLASSLSEANIPKEPYFNTLLRILCTRCMMQALYFSSGKLPEANFIHYGLATPIYTHFTSPIRRYADIIVHRLLAAAIGADSTYPDLLDRERTHHLCDRLNRRHKMAQYAQRASVHLHTQLFFKDRTVEEEAFILMPKRNSLQVLLPKYGYEGHIFFNNTQRDGTKGDYPKLVYNELNFTLTVGSHVFHSFDKLKVQLCIEKSNIQSSKVTISLVKPFIKGISAAPIERHDSEIPPSKKRKTVKSKI